MCDESIRLQAEESMLIDEEPILPLSPPKSKDRTPPNTPATAERSTAEVAVASPRKRRRVTPPSTPPTAEKTEEQKSEEVEKAEPSPRQRKRVRSPVNSKEVAPVAKRQRKSENESQTTKSKTRRKIASKKVCKAPAAPLPVKVKTPDKERKPTRSETKSVSKALNRSLKAEKEKQLEGIDVDKFYEQLKESGAEPGLVADKSKFERMLKHLEDLGRIFIHSDGKIYRL